METISLGFGKAIIDARNAPGSVAKDSMEAAWKANPCEKVHLWDGLILPFIHGIRYRGGSSISVLDLGCGVGAQLETICGEARLYKLEPKVEAIDKIPGNVYQTRTKLSQLGLDAQGVRLGDVTKFIPTGNYDLALSLELIHWLNPDQIKKLFKDVAENMNKGGLFVVSHATRFNNALLRDEGGNLDLHRSYWGPNDDPIYRYSYPCKTDMSFCSGRWLINVGKSVGLKAVWQEEWRNPYFPTCRELNISFRGVGSETSENAILGFLKK